MPKKKLILDVDTGTDDAVAIMLAALHPDLELVACTTVNGNQSIEHTTDNTLRTLDHIGRGEIPVHAGLSRPIARTDFPIPRGVRSPGVHFVEMPLRPARSKAKVPDAVEFLIETYRNPSDRITLVPVGPLSNIASALALFPKLAENVPEVIIMGGGHAVANVTPAAEFNVWADPEAARRVCMSGLDLTMVGLDVTHQALFTSDDTEAVRGRGVAGRLTAELVEFYARAHPDRPGTPIHDAVAVAQVIDPGLLSLEHCHVEIDCGPVSRGRTLVDRNHVTGEEPNVHVATGIDPRFTRWLAERIASLG